MTLNTQQYRKRPESVEAVELTASNLDEVARWCGGSIEKVHNTLSNSFESTGILTVPSLYGYISAEIGSFVAKELDTGRFSVMTREHLESEYERIGLRQNSPFPRLGGN